MLDTPPNLCRRRDRRSAPKARDQRRRLGPRKSQWDLKIVTWNISSIKNKETELVEEAIKYKLQLIGISSTKRIGAEPEPKEVHRGWKLYLSGVSPSVRAHAGVGILVSPA